MAGQRVDSGRRAQRGCRQFGAAHREANSFAADRLDRGDGVAEGDDAFGPLCAHGKTRQGGCEPVADSSCAGQTAPEGWILTKQLGEKRVDVAGVPADARGGNADSGVPPAALNGCQASVTAGEAKQLDRIAGPVDIFEMRLDPQVTGGGRGSSVQQGRLAVGNEDDVRVVPIDRICHEVTDSNGGAATGVDRFTARGLTNVRACPPRGVEQQTVECGPRDAPHRARQRRRRANAGRGMEQRTVKSDGADREQLVEQAHPVQDAGTQRAQAFAADLVAREAVLLDKRNSPPARREQAGRDAAGRAAADDEGAGHGSIVGDGGAGSLTGRFVTRISLGRRYE